MPEGLPTELLALLHHVELNQVGWRSRTLQRFILAALWSGEPTDPDGIPALISETVGVHVDGPAVERELERLKSDGDVIELPDRRLKLSEARRQALDADVTAVEANEISVRKRFEECLREHDFQADRDVAWSAFNEEFMIPLIKDLGARTYELLAPGGPQAQELRGFQALIEPLAKTFGESFRPAALAFLDPGCAEVRQYVLRRLDAHFAIQAESLDDATLEAVSGARDKPPELKIFVDTNFVFSILRLHDNPSNEVAERLADLIRRISTHVRVRLYVLPISVEEARRVLRAQIFNLSGVRLSGNLAHAAVALQFSGLATRYFAEASRSSTILTPEDFFGPYEENLVQVLKDRGVELFNAPELDSLRTDQGVIDDLLAQQELQKHGRLGGAKPYESNLHDMVVWHFVKSKRPRVIESPLDANYWVLTLDFGFIRFDKRRRLTSALPLCVPPATLMQLLQFWVPRDASLDAAIIAAIRLPLLFIGFDPEAERVSIRILKKLSRYENVGDLSLQSLSHVLTNQALRQRISVADSQEEEDLLIEKAFIEQTQILEQELRREREALETHKSAADERESHLSEAARRATTDVDRLAAELTQSETLTHGLESQLEVAHRETVLVRSELDDAKAELLATRLDRQKRSYVVKLVLALVGAIAIDLAGYILIRLTKIPDVIAVLIAGALGLCLWLVTSTRMLPKSPQLENWRFGMYLRRARGAALKVVGGVVIGVASAAIYETLRRG